MNMIHICILHSISEHYFIVLYKVIQEIMFLEKQVM